MLKIYLFWDYCNFALNDSWFIYLMIKFLLKTYKMILIFLKAKEFLLKGAKNNIK